MKRKLKSIVAVLAAMTLILSMTACNKLNEAVSNAADTAAQMLNGDVTGVIGKTYSTQWFTFNVKSIKVVDEYAGYTAPAGMKLVDVLVTETNIFSQDIPMGIFDFLVDEDSLPEYIGALEPLDNTMMPAEFTLTPKESAEYHMLFEVPAELSDLKLLYIEVDEDDNVGATFTIKFEA